MIRLLRYLLGLGLLIAGAVWLADRPGAVSLNWLGWQVETSVPVMMALTLVLAVLLFWLARIFAWLIGIPGSLGRMRSERRHRKGYEALTRGLVAVAAGDPKEALRQARQADTYLGAPPLSLLLTAQAAQLAGDEEGASRRFEEMSKRPETEFLGLRGLITQALKKGDSVTALRHARRAYRLKPGADWVITALFGLLVQEHAWDEALAVTQQALKKGVITGSLAKRRKAILTLELAGEAGDASHGAKLGENACAMLPDLPATAIVAAQRMQECGKENKAARLLEAAWKACPHPSLAEALLKLSEGQDALKQVLAVEKLVSGAPGHLESHLAVANAALKAKLWGKARAELEPLLGNQPQARAVALMSSIDEAEGRLADSLVWLKRLADAAPDPAWVCASCGQVAEAWTSTCPNCHSFDTLAWKTPERSLPLLEG